MYKTSAFLVLLLCSLIAAAQPRVSRQQGKSLSAPQRNSIALTPDNWEVKPNSVEFLTWQSVPAMKITSSDGSAVLKGIDFSDGTIEYDMDPVDPRFTSMYFRQSSTDERECFYFRTKAAGNNMAMDAIQYAPFIAGVNLWDMLPGYQGNATYERGKWNHVKLVISGKQMWVYINDTARAALKIPRLEANAKHGSIGFEGQVIIANLVIRPGDTGGLSPVESPDPTDSDPRYLRTWKVTSPLVTTKDVDFSSSFMPAKEAAWEDIWTERGGLVNLTRKFGMSKERRIVWLKTNIHADKQQLRKLNLGFSDEVWVFINGKYLYVDKNLYGMPIMKTPEGRCSIENTAFNVPLNEGDNELLIGVANSFYGWGIIARLD